MAPRGSSSKACSVFIWSWNSPYLAWPERLDWNQFLNPLRKDTFNCSLHLQTGSQICVHWKIKTCILGKKILFHLVQLKLVNRNFGKWENSKSLIQRFMDDMGWKTFMQMKWLVVTFWGINWLFNTCSLFASLGWIYGWDNKIDFWRTVHFLSEILFDLDWIIHFLEQGLI